MSKASGESGRLKDGALNLSDFETFQTDSKHLIAALLPSAPARGSFSRCRAASCPRAFLSSL